MFEFLWGKRDKIKRSVIINEKMKGGLSMIDIERFFAALKAAWILRLIIYHGRWKEILLPKISQCDIDLEYILRYI